jgi:hypothetical protein
MKEAPWIGDGASLSRGRPREMPIAIEGPVDMLNFLLTGKISPIHAERLLNQVRRPVQAVGGLDARPEPSGLLAVCRIA